MSLDALELVEGGQRRVLVVEMHHEADRDQVVVEVVQPGAAAGVVFQRPAHRVLDEPGLMLLGPHLPQLLQSDAVFLVIAALIQPETVDHLLGEVAPRAFGEHRVPGPKLHAPRKTLLGGPVLGDAHVARGDADDAVLVVEQDFGGREPGIDLGAERLRLRAEIAADIAERADEVPVIAHQLGHEHVGQPHARGRPQIQELVARHLRMQRAALVGAPLRQEAVEPDRVDHRPRENVGADLGSFFHDDDRKLRSLLGRELPEADRGRQPGRTGAHDDDVELHRFALGQFHRRAPDLTRWRMTFPTQARQG
jgi:hypothetical protein